MKKKVYAGIFELAESVMYNVGFDSRNRMQIHAALIRNMNKSELQKYSTEVLEYVSENGKMTELKSAKTEHWRRAVSCAQYARNRLVYTNEDTPGSGYAG